MASFEWLFKLLTGVSPVSLLMTQSYVCFFTLLGAAVVSGLQPLGSESRQVLQLDGLWSFRLDSSPDRNDGFKQTWYKRPLSETGPVMDMPVPSSYNDLMQTPTDRDFVGWAWYERRFRPPIACHARRARLHFASVHYYAIVWLDGLEIATHEGGHLPFEADISSILFQAKGRELRLTVAANNTLTPNTIPPGRIIYMNDTSQYPPGYFVQEVDFDFFNYAGIDRPVSIICSSQVYVEDILVTTNFSASVGFVFYNISIAGGTVTSIFVGLRDPKGRHVAGDAVLPDHICLPSFHSTLSPHGLIKVPNVSLWWPVGMNTTPGLLYTLELRGRGYDAVTMAKDASLLSWLGANAFRTSHYPYAEQTLDMADRQGILVISEAPAVGLVTVDNFGKRSLEQHMTTLRELINRDRNHPSVIMWSLANEPASNLQVAESYFRQVIAEAHRLDGTRPVTVVLNKGVSVDRVAQYLDVVSVNAYFGWYHDSGHPELIGRQLGHMLSAWYTKHHHPVILMEYGAGSVAGLHSLPSVMFSEEYHLEVMRQHFPVFDEKRKDFLVGEMLWNLVDFNTPQGVKRMAGNRKGLFTRNRQPKMAAFLLRDRYVRLNNASAHPLIPWCLGN
uniref:beta-glucuronidase isoform X2 n=1 Tax=Myxine glutinosa TaxID=7769 RepID=UPI00358F49D0